MSLLDVKDLKTYFYTDSGVAKAVDGVTFSVDKGKVLGIVGESGCGKSVTSLSIMRLVDPVTGKNEGGEILFDGTDILKLPEPEMRKLRGNRISMIFQEPMTSLNPVFTIGYHRTGRIHNLTLYKTPCFIHGVLLWKNFLYFGMRILP